MADGSCRVQPFGANRHTVLDTMATEHTEGIIQIGQSLLGGQITTVCQKTIRLQQTGRTDKFIRVPPEGRATG
jgi:hypothetical protein